MKSLRLLFTYICLTSISWTFIFAQTDATGEITNPSFEEDGADVNLPDMPSGWTWIGTDGYTWCGVNTDAEDTAKTGDYIAGTWNATIGDIELSQSISDLENGMYEVTCDLMGGSSNATTSRMTTQRLFAKSATEEKCMLYGADTAASYSAENLDILDDTEEYSFGGYAEYESDRTPFETLTVEIEVTDGNLTIGVRSNGTDSEMGYTFPHLTTGDGYGWFKVDNFTLNYLGTATGINDPVSAENDLKVIVRDGYITVPGVEDFKIYNLRGSLVPSDYQLNKGVYIIKANGKHKKVIVQ